VGSDLEDEVVEILGVYFFDEFLERPRVGGGDVEAGVNLSVSNISGQCGNKGDFEVSGFEEVVDEGGSGGFAVGAGDGDDL